MPSLAERIAKARRQLKRRGKSIKARRRARARSRKRGPKARKKAEKQRRIEQNNPESLTEAAQATAQEVSRTAGAASTTASEAKEFIAAEIGAGEEEASEIIEIANTAIERGGEALEQLDVDGDGDTDALVTVENALDETAVAEPGAVVGQADAPTEPVLGIAPGDAADDALMAPTDGEVTLDAPTPGEVPLDEEIDF